MEVDDTLSGIRLDHNSCNSQQWNKHLTSLRVPVTCSHGYTQHPHGGAASRKYKPGFSVRRSSNLRWSRFSFQTSCEQTLTDPVDAGKPISDKSVTHSDCTDKTYFIDTVHYLDLYCFALLCDNKE